MSKNNKKDFTSLIQKFHKNLKSSNEKDVFKCLFFIFSESKKTEATKPQS